MIPTNEDEKYKTIKARVGRMREFYSSLVSYFIVNIVLIVINLLTSPHNLWFYWVTVIWGIVLLIRWINLSTIKDRYFGDDWEKKKIEELMRKDKSHKE